MPAWFLRVLQLTGFLGLILWGGHLAAQAPQDGTDRGVKVWFFLFAIGWFFGIEKLLRANGR